MAREPARAGESPTPPRCAKDALGDEDSIDGRWAPEATRGHPGGSDPPQAVRGCSTPEPAAALCRRPPPVVVTQRGSCDVRRLRGLNGRLGTRSAWEIAALSATEKAPGAIRSADAVQLRASGAWNWLVWGPGAGVEAAGRLCPAVMDRGRKHTSACRQAALARATPSKAARLTSELGSPRGRMGLRGNRRRPRKTPARPSRRKWTPATGLRDGCGSLGQEVGAQGALARPERARGCSIPSLPLRYVGEDRTNVERLIRCCRSPRGRKERSKGSRPEPALPATTKAPEQSGPADGRSESYGSYGDPVLEWGRPGGSVSAIMGQG